MKPHLILCTTATPARSNLPKEDIAQEFKNSLKSIEEFTPDIFQKLTEEWQAHQRNATQSDELIKRRLFEIARGRKKFGEGSTIEIEGLSCNGLRISLTVGTRLAVAFLRIRITPIIRESALPLIPSIKSLILSRCPDVSFEDVIDDGLQAP